MSTNSVDFSEFLCVNDRLGAKKTKLGPEKGLRL